MVWRRSSIPPALGCEARLDLPTVFEQHGIEIRERARRECTPDLLQGFRADDSPDIAHWLGQERQGFRNRYWFDTVRDIVDLPVLGQEFGRALARQDQRDPSVR
jgi:hypothetical protein